jgi:hypothetical protein
VFRTLVLFSRRLRIRLTFTFREISKQNVHTMNSRKKCLIFCLVPTTIFVFVVKKFAKSDHCLRVCPSLAQNWVKHEQMVEFGKFCHYKCGKCCGKQTNYRKHFLQIHSLINFFHFCGVWKKIWVRSRCET